MPANSLSNLDSLLNQAVTDGVFPGAVAGWVSTNGDRQVICAGQQSTESSPAVTATTVYDTASLSKSICTALLAQWLVDHGTWKWSDLLTQWLPQYTGDHADSLTLHDLQSFGVPFALTLSSLKKLPAQTLWDTILESPIASAVGKQPLYLNTTSILLGRAIEETTGNTLPELAESLLWQPLGMHQTSFAPTDLSRVVPSEIDTWRDQEIHGQVHDESAWALRPLFTAGSAGVFSTVPDVLTLLEAILKTAAGRETALPLSTESVKSFATNVFPTPHHGALGWELNAAWMGNVPPGTFGKTGFTGCSIVANLEVGRAGVILSNATYPHRPTDRGGLEQLRKSFNQSLLS